MTEKRIMNRWLVVAGAVLIQVCLGAIYAWSAFTSALKDADWSTVQTQVVFSVGLVTFAVVMVFAGRLLKAWGPRRLAMISAIVLGAGYALAGLLGSTNFWVVVICVGGVGGAGIGLGYVVPIAVGIRWFPDKKGLITGLAVAGFGFGAMGWVKLAGSWGELIKEIGLSGTFTAYGIAFTCIILLGAIWMVFPPDGWKPKGYEPPAPVAPTGGGKGRGAEYTSLEMLGNYQFYMIFFTFVISAGAGLMAIGLMKAYPVQALMHEEWVRVGEILSAAGLTDLADTMTRGGLKGLLQALNLTGLDQAATYLQGQGWVQAKSVLAGLGEMEESAGAIAGTAMAVFFSLSNGIGRIAWGMLSDKLGRRISILIMVTTQGFLMILFSSMAGSEYTLYLGAALIGFNFGGNFALFPTITADVFGAKNVGQNYPYVFLAYGVGGIGGPILGGMLGDMGDFPLAFTICGIACIGSATFMSLVRKLKNGD